MRCGADAFIKTLAGRQITFTFIPAGQFQCHADSPSASGISSKRFFNKLKLSRYRNLLRQARQKFYRSCPLGPDYHFAQLTTGSRLRSATMRIDYHSQNCRFRNE